MVDRTGTYWIRSACLGLLCLSCHDEVKTKSSATDATNMAGEAIAGHHLAGGEEAGVESAGEVESGGDTVEQQDAGEQANAALSCVDGLVMGPMWAEKLAMNEVMADAEDEDRQIDGSCDHINDPDEDDDPLSQLPFMNLADPSFFSVLVAYLLRDDRLQDGQDNFLAASRDDPGNY